MQVPVVESVEYKSNTFSITSCTAGKSAHKPRPNHLIQSRQPLRRKVEQTRVTLKKKKSFFFAPLCLALPPLGLKSEPTYCLTKLSSTGMSCVFSPVTLGIALNARAKPSFNLARNRPASTFFRSSSNTNAKPCLRITFRLPTKSMAWCRRRKKNSLIEKIIQLLDGGQ